MAKKRSFNYHGVDYELDDNEELLKTVCPKCGGPMTHKASTDAWIESCVDCGYIEGGPVNEFGEEELA